MGTQTVDIRKPGQYSVTLKSSRKARAMTIAIGMLCSDGIVLAADRQLTREDGHKYQEQKIFPIDGGDWKAVLTYSGSPDFVKEVQQKLVSSLNREEIKVDCRAIRDALEEILNGLGRQYGDVGTDLLVAAYGNQEVPQLMKFDGKAIHGTHGFNCLGVGDSSLISFLSEALYRPELTVQQGIRLAVYLVSKANRYIDKCGGGPDIATLGHQGRIGGVGQAQVGDMYSEMESAEIQYLSKIIEVAG